MNIRQNIYTLTDTQLADLQTALNACKADGSYDTFIHRHHMTMMTATTLAGEGSSPNIRNVAHRGPAFGPWHRYFLRELELLLQSKRPMVTLPYWDWSADAANPFQAPLWNTDPTKRIYIGGDGTGPNGTITGPFAHWVALLESTGVAMLTPRSFPGIIRQFGNGHLPTPANVTHAVNDFPTYDTAPWSTSSSGSFRNQLEGWAGADALHNTVHVWVGGDMSPGTSPNDPVFFLHHCNIDRVWALWQAKFPNAPYLPAAGGPPGHNAGDTMQFLTTANATPQRSLDYRRELGFIYDTDAPLVELPDSVVNFDDVPTLETTWRAAVFHVRAAGPIHLTVTGLPAAPYGLTPLGATVTHTPPVDNAPYDEVRVWFAFTGEAVAGVAAVGHAEVHCTETNETFAITLEADTVPRPTTGVVFVLDQSGSMSDPAGTGPTRMQVLHEAASRCVELIRDDSGAGCVSFDQDAHPGRALAPFSPAASQRSDVLATINGLAPAGATSIGDGVELGRQVLTAGLAPFDSGALLVLTDGLENQPDWLDDVMGSIDQRTFGVGLGTAQQVSVASMTRLANNTDGYVLLTGALGQDTDSYFLLSKYFQQILVSATNDTVVTDPSGFVTTAADVRVPFRLAATDIEATAVLMLDHAIADLALETPGGNRLTAAELTAAGATVGHGTNMTFCRMALPLGGTDHAGTWNIVISVDPAKFKRVLTTLRREKDETALRRLEAHGARYSASVTAWSNLRLQAHVHQKSFEPGATLVLDAALRESGEPLNTARVIVRVTDPAGNASNLALDRRGGGLFVGKLDAQHPGAWRFRVTAQGRTTAGEPFTREQLLTAAVVAGGDRPAPHRPGEDKTSRIVARLIEDPDIRKVLEKRADRRDLTELLLRAGRTDAKALNDLG
jgi:hypothetical protein